jgi:hypothetical protein
MAGTGRSVRIAITNNAYWRGVVDDFRASHPSRNWGDATIVAHLAELGYRVWSAQKGGVQPLPFDVPAMQADVKPTPPLPVVASSLPTSDDFPFEGFIK